MLLFPPFANKGKIEEWVLYVVPPLFFPFFFFQLSLRRLDTPKFQFRGSGAGDLRGEGVKAPGGFRPPLFLFFFLFFP